MRYDAPLLAIGAGRTAERRARPYGMTGFACCFTDWNRPNYLEPSPANLTGEMRWRAEYLPVC